MVNTSYGNIPDNELILKENIPYSHEYPSPKLAYFVGYMCGDAGLKDIKRSKKITGQEEFKIIVGDEFLCQVEILKRLFHELFKKETKIRTERIEKGINFYYVNPTSKEIYKLLTEKFEFPSGPKCGLIKVSKIILDSSKITRKWFIRGVFDSDGGVKTVENPKRRIGGNLIYLTTKSQKFANQIYKMIFDDFNVDFFKPSSNGKDGCWKTGTGSIQAIKVLNKQKIFIHPIKRWRLQKLSSVIRGHSSTRSSFG